HFVAVVQASHIRKYGGVFVGGSGHTIADRSRKHRRDQHRHDSEDDALSQDFAHVAHFRTTCAPRRTGPSNRLPNSSASSGGSSSVDVTSSSISWFSAGELTTPKPIVAFA